jgi:hypothetical protein
MLYWKRKKAADLLRTHCFLPSLCRTLFIIERAMPRFAPGRNPKYRGIKIRRSKSFVAISRRYQLQLLYCRMKTKYF